MESPLMRIPLDSQEQPILDSLLRIRNQLELLKQDRSCYVQSDDVLRLYKEIVEQVDALNRIRVTKREEQNRVDTVLDDCFQLISLAFMTIGKNSEAPAIYSVVSTIKRLLDHLREAAFYSPKDLGTLSRYLQKYQNTIDQTRDAHDPHLVTLLEARIAICNHTIAQLQQHLSRLTPEMADTYEKLVSILRSLSACNVKSNYSRGEVASLQSQLKEIQDEFPKHEIDALHVSLREILDKLHQPSGLGFDDKILQKYAENLNDTAARESQSSKQIIMELLGRCVVWAEIVEQRIGPGFGSVFDKLLQIRKNLESRSLLMAWTMRETDIFSFQRQLDRIDEARTPDGNFLDDLGRPADLQTQRTLLYLLRKSYAIIYFLLTSSKPVSEALLPIYNQLKTLRKCLKEVRKAGGVSSMRELYPYMMKLSSIDKTRIDGKFVIGDATPDGQETVLQLLEDCHDYMNTLQADLDEQESQDRGTSKDDVPHPTSEQLAA